MAAEKQLVVGAGTAYDADFYQWTQATAEKIRQGRMAEVDWPLLAEEIQDMGKRDRRELRSRLIVLVGHLLKWQRQPESRTSSWRSTIVEQRMQIQLLMQDSPSLAQLAWDELSVIYGHAMKSAITDTLLRPECFPQSCPYTPEQVLDGDFFP